MNLQMPPDATLDVLKELHESALEAIVTHKLSAWENYYAQMSDDLGTVIFLQENRGEWNGGLYEQCRNRPEPTIEAHLKALYDYMSALCEEHQSASWVEGWAHYLWDAMLSDGVFYRHTGSEERRLTPEELATLRRLAGYAPGHWVDLATDFEPGGEHETFDPNAWTHCHTVWLTTADGKANERWRTKMEAITGKKVEILAKTRDALLEKVRSISLPEGMKIDIHCDTGPLNPKTQTVLAWLPADARAVIEPRYPAEPQKSIDDLVKYIHEAVRGEERERAADALAIAYARYVKSEFNVPRKEVNYGFVDTTMVDAELGQMEVRVITMTKMPPVKR